MNTNQVVSLGTMMMTLDVDALEARIVRRWGLARRGWGGHAVWALLVGAILTISVNMVGCVS